MTKRIVRSSTRPGGLRRIFLGLALGASACASPGLPPPSRSTDISSLPSDLPPTIVLDAGHGGIDSGATGKGAMEKDISLHMARKVKERLERNHDFTVLMTRDSDVFVPLDERVRKSLELQGNLFVSLHVNNVRKKRLRKVNGLVVYYFGRSREKARRYSFIHPPPLPPPPKEMVARSKDLAKAVVNYLKSKRWKIKNPESDDYYVLKNPNIPSILIEMGYLSNPKESSELQQPAYQDRLADALAAGLDNYLAALRPPRAKNPKDSPPSASAPTTTPASQANH